MSLALIGVIFLVFLPQLVDYDEVAVALGSMTWLELTTLTVLALWNQATYWFVEMEARPGLGVKEAMQITFTSTMVSNTLPAGAALGAGLQTAMYLSFGFSKPDVAISLMLTGLWNTFVKLAMPILALALLALSGGADPGLAAAALIGLAFLLAGVLALVLVLRSERGAYVVARWFRPLGDALLRMARREPIGDWGRRLATFRLSALSVLSRKWVGLTTSVLVSHLTLYVLLLLTLRHVGIAENEVGWIEALAAFAFVRLISVVPITPGGLGVVELGATAALVAAGGPRPQVVAAVLVFRALSFVLPIPFGAIAYLVWRRGRGRGRRPSADPAGLEDVTAGTSRGG